MNYSSTVYAIAISLAASPASNRVWESLNSSTAEEAYDRVGRLTSMPHISQKYPEDTLEAASRIFEICKLQSVGIIDFWDESYPSLLKETFRPPLVLYVKGVFNAFNAVAVVGTRKADQKSRAVARRISAELCSRGFVIVSGMAVGIDREAHLGALENGGDTIGVLANGIDIAYPSRNRDLYDIISTSGRSCLISEYPPGIVAGKWTFARRNRIISGIATGTVVVKAAEKSGALITAKFALEQNREVFACPGNSFDIGYYGCNRLIRQGAVPVSVTEDIIQELEKLPYIESVNYTGTYYNGSRIPAGSVLSKPPRMADAAVLNETERVIIKHLGQGDCSTDSLVAQLDLPVSSVIEAVMNLELMGLIYKEGNTIGKL